jgi:hypothetical protein
MRRANLCLNFNDFLTKLKGQEKLIYDTLGTVTAFEMKPKLFRKLFENVKMCHFPSYDLLHKDGSVSVPSPSVRVVEVADPLAEYFKNAN